MLAAAAWVAAAFAGDPPAPALEYYRDLGPGCVPAMLEYAGTHLAAAVAARCSAAGVAGPALSRGVYHGGRDAVLYAGADGWTTAEGTAGTALAGVRYRDADGDRRRGAAEPVWLDADGDGAYTAGEPVLWGEGVPPSPGAWGQPFPERVCVADADGDGAWDPGEDVWSEPAAGDCRDLAALAAALARVRVRYVNHLEEASWDGGAVFARLWTDADLLAALGQEGFAAPPGSVPATYAGARELGAWLAQSVAVVELLQVLPGPSWSLKGSRRRAFVCRGPYYELRLAMAVGPHDGDVVRLTLPPALLTPFSGVFSWSSASPDPAFAYGSLVHGAVCSEALVGYYLDCDGGNWCGAPRVERCVPGADYLGRYYSMVEPPWPGEPGGAPLVEADVTASPADPPRIAYSRRHTVAGGGEAVAGEALPPETSTGALFEAEWAAAEWQPAAGGVVRAYRWESDTGGYWQDGHDTAVGQELYETTAAAEAPAGPGIDVYVRVGSRSGSPGLFEGTEPGRYRLERRLPGGAGGRVELRFAPAGVPAVPNPVYPGGEYEATSELSFTVHSVLRCEGLPGFGPLPRPIPGAAAPGLPGTAGGERDTDLDDLVEVGADLISFGPDTGQIALRPEWPRAQVLLPLATALWDELPVQAYLCQGGFADRPETFWTHPDAGPLWLAFSLHTRAYVERAVRTAAARVKIAEVVRPRGNRVAFEFPWDAGAGAFSAVGFPLPPNDRRGYVLRDLTPGEDLDAAFELRFESGIAHVFAGGSGADGRLVEVRHSDGRRTAVAALTDCRLDLAGNRFVSPVWEGRLEWSGGRPARVEYRRRCGGGTVSVEVGWAATPAGPRAVRLAKSIPELSVELAGGEDAGGEAVRYGSGVQVRRTGGTLTLSRPDGTRLVQTVTLNADGLPERVEWSANGSSHAVNVRYVGGSWRHPANGAAAWTRPFCIEYPDGFWERFVYDPETGWPAARVVPFGDAGPEAPESSCRVTRFGYDSSLSGGLPADPAQLAERPRLAVTETLGVETARQYHAWGTDPDGRRYGRTRRCVRPGAAWDAPDNLEETVRFNRFGPPDMDSPAGCRRCAAGIPRDDRLTVCETLHTGQTRVWTCDAAGTVYSWWAAEDGPGFPLTLEEWYSGIDPFGRVVRTDYGDGTWEASRDVQWHGGPLRQRLRDGSEAECAYTADGRLRRFARYGVTTTLTYDDLGLVASVRCSAGGLATQTRTAYDSQGRPVLLEDELGRRTVIAYEGASRRVTFPDGSCLEEQRRRDGSPAALAGSAVAETRFQQGVDPEAGPWEAVVRRSGAGFVDRTVAWGDLLGRVRQTARTLESGALAMQTLTAWDAAGRPCRRTDGDGVTELLAYDSRGEVCRRAVDLDGDGTISAADEVEDLGREAVLAAPPDGGPRVPCVHWTVRGPAEGGRRDRFVSADGQVEWTVENGAATVVRTRLGEGPGEAAVAVAFPDGSSLLEEYAEGLLRRVCRRDAAGAIVSWEAYEYDALRRLCAVVDGRTGEAVRVELDAAGRLVTLRRPGDQAGERYERDAMGRVVRAWGDDGAAVDWEYDPAGRLLSESGAGVFPRRFQYDPRGLCEAMWTFRGGLDGEGAALTEWLFDPYSGRPAGRRLQGVTVEEYGWTPAGRLEQVVQRLPEGDRTTRFERDAAGRVAAVVRGERGAAVRLERDRAGRLTAVRDGLGERRFEWDAGDRLVAESLPQLPGGSLRRTYDAAGRRTVLTLSAGGRDLASWAWSWDGAGRLESVSDGTCTARYVYVPGSDLVACTRCAGPGGVERVRIEREWDEQGRVAAIRALSPADLTLTSWSYAYDAAGRRTSTLSEPADPAAPGAPRRVCRWEYRYDEIGQLAAATGLDPARGETLPGRAFVYLHDTIANRLTAGRLDPAAARGEETYAANDGNQYTSRTVPGAVHVAGAADPEAAVTVGGQPAERRGEEFQARLPVANQAGAAPVETAVRAVRWSPAEDRDLIAEVSAGVVVPAAEETFAAAGAGGLAADSRWLYEWDQDDRLAAVEERAPLPGRPRRRLEFACDWLGRRTVRRLYEETLPETPGAAPAGWTLRAETVFVWDGWTLLAEFEVLPGGGRALRRSFLWGLDLAGLRDGQPDPRAGGIGGLVAVCSFDPAGAGASAPRPQSAVFTVADAAGHVSALVDALGPAGLLETREWEPFGRLLARHRAPGPEPLPDLDQSECPLGFSSKYAEPLAPGAEMYDFGYRWYRPDLGRWLCRDPLAEAGGPNLYAFCGNDPVNAIDPLGERAYGYDYTGPLGPYDWQEKDYSQAEVDLVYSHLAARDRHIFNPGLANTPADREAARSHLEQALGVPVVAVWNPSFVTPGVAIVKVGQRLDDHEGDGKLARLGHRSFSWLTQGAGFGIQGLGIVLDVAVAGLEKIPPLYFFEPTNTQGYRIYERALNEVQATGDKDARVYGWMHSEGAIYGATILSGFFPERYPKVVVVTLGAGGYMFPRKVYCEHYACISAGGWKDPVPQVAALNGLWNRKNINWVKIPEHGWPHGFETYLKYVVMDRAKEYFRTNAGKLLGK